jgi:hypothetical protein
MVGSAIAAKSAPDIAIVREIFIVFQQVMTN